MEYIAFYDGEIIAYSRDENQLQSQIRYWVEKNKRNGYDPECIEIFKKITLDWQ